MEDNKEASTRKLLDNKILENSKGLQTYIFTMVQDNYAKDEIFQNSIIRAYRSIGNLQDPERLMVWLVKIIKTETLRYYNKEKQWNDLVEYELDSSYDVDIEDVFEEVNFKESQGEILLMLESIGEKYEQILLLHYYYEMSLKEIALLMKMNYHTVKVYHQRGLAMLKKRFGNALEERKGRLWPLGR